MERKQRKYLVLDEQTISGTLATEGLEVVRPEERVAELKGGGVRRGR